MLHNNQSKMTTTSGANLNFCRIYPKLINLVFRHRFFESRDSQKNIFRTGSMLLQLLKILRKGVFILVPFLLASTPTITSIKYCAFKFVSGAATGGGTLASTLDQAHNVFGSKFCIMREVCWPECFPLFVLSPTE